ncbi:GNAT family N-acetyltransferase [uncultured Paraglaciecola sp.]|uniref:GNAT family N-acetyltransferase n=1 Tax=uncultured Paraglaciecola sp. TaxID=1765024 RepID=UPI00261C5D1A|nr:GNAT family N-acetyltransferase [uncultured Paraglaciecola sp.]
MNIRKAKQQDATILAPLVFSSAPIAFSATFDIDQKLSAINFLQASLASADGQYGYANHWLVEKDDCLLGCVSAWHSDLADSFHQATLTKLIDFYGMAQALAVVQVSLTMQDCIPKPLQHEWCIGHFAVDEKFQRQGVGRALLELMQKQAMIAGKHALSLDVDSSNSQALDFYMAQGFSIESQSRVSDSMLSLGIGCHFHLTKILV